MKRSSHARNEQFVFTLLIVFMLSIGAELQPCSASSADLQLEGFEYVKAKNFAKALECFNGALKEHPNSWAIMQSIGNCQMELGRYDAAIANLQKSIESGGLQASQCISMAAVYQRKGDAKKALNWLKLACSCEPSKASDPGIQAAMTRLLDPANNPTGSPTTPDYCSSLVSFKGWPQKAMPIKVYLRPNPQISGFFSVFSETIKDSLGQWRNATGNTISYKFVDSPESANLICDYTDHRELVSSQHDLGINGNTEMLVKQDNTPGSANIVVLVKDGPAAPFRNRALLTLCCLHEVGHALGMHGHSPNLHDVMFPVATLSGAATLSERDKNTIRRIYLR